MNIKIIVIIILFIILLYTILIIINKSKSPVLFNTNSQENNDCSLMPMKCEELGKPCIECSDGIYSCQEVPGDQYDSQGKLIKKGGLTIITKNNGNDIPINISAGKYCLPAQVDSSTCNPYTSDPVLRKVSNGLFKWECYCKKPEWISSGGLGSDCNVPVMCNARASVDNKLLYCKTGEYFIDSETGKGKCSDSSQPVEWTPKSNVEMENIFCSCSPGTYFYENSQLGIKDCIDNPCGDTPPQYDTNGNMFCKCKSGEISCSTLPDDKKSECSIGCLPDPCIPKIITDKCKKTPNDPSCICYYDPGIQKCVCGNEYIQIQDKNFITNGYCIPKNSACTKDIIENCGQKRGGKCISCVDPGNNTADYATSHCVNCKARNGFLTKYPLPVNSDGNLSQQTIASYCKKNPNNDCKPCALTFTKCSSDIECCTGRCHDGTCYPTNGFGWDSNDRDEKCHSNTNGERGVSNIYNIRGNWDDQGALYMGFCESTKCDPMVDWNCVPDNFKSQGKFDYNCPGVSV